MYLDFQTIYSETSPFMSDLHILRPHALGLPAARKIAVQWAEHIERKFGMSCRYEHGASVDELCFSSAGVDGTLCVAEDRFEVKAKLGFLLAAFKPSIESEIARKLDQLLASPHSLD